MSVAQNMSVATILREHVSLEVESIDRMYLNVYGPQRTHLAALLGCDPSELSPGRMTDDPRRLRLHGLIERIPQTHRYRPTPAGLRTALFFTRVYGRILRRGLARLAPTTPLGGDALRPYFDRLEVALDRYIAQAKLAA